MTTSNGAGVDTVTEYPEASRVVRMAGRSAASTRGLHRVAASTRTVSRRIRPLGLRFADFDDGIGSLSASRMAEGQGGGSRVEWDHSLARLPRVNGKDRTGGDTLVRTRFDSLSLLHGRSFVVPRVIQRWRTASKDSQSCEEPATARRYRSCDRHSRGCAHRAGARSAS